ncbi:phage holin family protein [Actinocorallia longicatena]|uniref:Phage holin family protein n=1 Tax=Actinocorallia longicatena TaxID=111803 RepID=A0ABP6QGM9_9ACTN
MADESTANLVKQASEQLSHLVRAELRLAATELKDKARRGGTGGGLLAGAGLLALYAFAALLVAAGAALALVLPVWAAAVIVAVVLLLGAGVLGLTGRKRLAEAVPPVPEEALHSVAEDVAEIKERAHR